MVATVNNRLKLHLTATGTISENQSGFLNNRSTLDQLFRLEAAISLAFNNRSKRHRHFVAIFLDFVDHMERGPHLKTQQVWHNGGNSQTYSTFESPTTVVVVILVVIATADSLSEMFVWKCMRIV
ncbi:hypothetical protein CHS0354_015532 [Potamilus streckersoni]|uniref:Reverse transcriptase domain-containing protein n=1 Tax=Potamilus streckersoni TaxID=2493646 RepID=A0AAE0T6J5_9BIVA|nr:hypothetical protein CHS0354_015532 [Potamilus streckersoni]